MTNIVKADIEKIASARLSWEKLQGKTVLVTGATGFIGSFIIHSLMKKWEDDGLDVKVLALVRNADRARLAYGEYEAKGRLSFLVQDVCQPLPTDKKADFIITGQWAKKAFSEAKKYGDVKAVASSEDEVYTYIPKTSKEKLKVFL